MIRRRTADAGVLTKIGNHAFRAAATTEYLKNCGNLHASARAQLEGRPSRAEVCENANRDCRSLSTIDLGSPQSIHKLSISAEREEIRQDTMCACSTRGAMRGEPRSDTRRPGVVQNDSRCRRQALGTIKLRLASLRTHRKCCAWAICSSHEWFLEEVIKAVHRRCEMHCRRHRFDAK